MQGVEPDILHRGRFLELVRRDGWEYAQRTGKVRVVAILPVHDDGRLVLVEQFRPAVDARVIEWPAGLVGDQDAGESLLDAAKRELLEETGYVAERWTLAGEGLSSAGLTDENVVFFLAKGLTRQGPGGGVDGEDIVRHEVPAAEAFDWLETMRAAGRRVDVKVYAGLAMLNTYSGENQP